MTPASHFRNRTGVCFAHGSDRGRTSCDGCAQGSMESSLSARSRSITKPLSTVSAPSDPNDAGVVLNTIINAIVEQPPSVSMNHASPLTEPRWGGSGPRSRVRVAL